MTSRICTLLLLVTACQLDPKTIGDPTGASSGESDTDGASSEPMSTSQGSDSEPATSDGTSDSDTTPGTSDSDTTPGTSVSGSTGVGTSDSDSETEGVVVMCQGGPGDFPDFPDACESDNDCAIGNHAVDCCGSLHAIGIDADAEQAFIEAELLCQSQYPLCDCAPKATVADDGATLDDGEQVVVACNDNRCETTIVDPCADVMLPPCPPECSPELFPGNCGEPCPEEGATCGNNIGDAMVCNAGVWGCIIHPPLGEGCSLVCK